MRTTSILSKFAILLLFFISACSSAPSFRGKLLEPAMPAPAINLADQSGNLFHLSDSKGKVVLIFFGFTNCPDECPLTAAHLKQAVELVGDRAGEVQVVMVSTDPVRDTPQAMGAFLGKFNPSFVGIPGTTESLSQIWNDYGVVVLNGGETHSSFIYVIDQAGNLCLSFTSEMSPEDIASDLKTLLSEQ